MYWDLICIGIRFDWVWLRIGVRLVFNLLGFVLGFYLFWDLYECFQDKLREVEETLVEKKARIEKEESTLDKKISTLKSQMLQLRSDSQV